MNGLLTVERMVLESISNKKDEIRLISEDTGLKETLIKTVSSNLLSYGLIEYKKGKYFLTQSLDRFNDINRPANLKDEVRDLFDSLLKNHFRPKDSEFAIEHPVLKMQKIWLTNKEYILLKGMMKNIESFIDSTREARKIRPEQELLAEQKVIFWGVDSYFNLIQTPLKLAR